MMSSAIVGPAMSPRVHEDSLVIWTRDLMISVQRRHRDRRSPASPPGRSRAATCDRGDTARGKWGRRGRELSGPQGPGPAVGAGGPQAAVFPDHSQESGGPRWLPTQTDSLVLVALASAAVDAGAAVLTLRVLFFLADFCISEEYMPIGRMRSG